MKEAAYDICIVGPYETSGGVATATFNYALLFKKLGYKVLITPQPREISIRKCKVVQVNGLYFLGLLHLLLSSHNVYKILTFHGWVMDEAKIFLQFGKQNILKRILGFSIITYIFLIYKLLFIPFIFTYVTAVSEITKNKNNVKAIVIPNVFFKEKIKNKLKECKKIKKENMNKDTYKIITYVSIGGGKNLSLLRGLYVMVILNKILTKYGKRLEFYIFGKDIPSYLYNYLNRYDFIKFMGYTKYYLCYLANADLFFMPYDMPELGYAALEAVALGVPLAKFTNDFKYEEIIDGYNGILARDSNEMIKKLLFYFSNIDELKSKFAKNAEATILFKHSPQYIGVAWKKLIDTLLERL